MGGEATACGKAACCCIFTLHIGKSALDILATLPCSPQFNAVGACKFHAAMLILSALSCSLLLHEVLCDAGRHCSTT